MLAGNFPFNDDPANPDGENINLLYNYIVSTSLNFPDYVTPHARDLLRRMLVPDPRKRADLLEVARHSWLSEYSHVVAFVSGGADPEPNGGVKASADVASPRGTV
jgi:protein-serine/threonine kinase